MIQVNRYFLTEFERKILHAISEAGATSVKEVHIQLENVHYIRVMRGIHKLHRKGYLFQKHIGYEAIYKVKPRILTELRKANLQQVQSQS